ncbi:MAG: class I SAM-dependent methyltransferase [Candidatus Micrarchaeota archaeon]
MGGRRVQRQQERLPRPILELLAADPRTVSVPNLFRLVNEFAVEKRKRDIVIEKAQAAIKQIYDSFNLAQRVRFFAMLYDQFSDRYDQHMGIETRHYQAIRTVLQYAAPFLRTPIVDLTAGTGEPMRYVQEILERSRIMRAAGIDHALLAPEQEIQPVHINEVSPKMLEKAREKLGIDIRHTNMSAYDFSIGGFRTVVCSQTFHLISNDDKPRMVRAIKDALVTGGIAVVIEEDPFRISPVLPLDIALFLDAIVRPLKHPGELIGHFITNGFTKLEERAVAPIDEFHSMRLHLFVKN